MDSASCKAGENGIHFCSLNFTFELSIFFSLNLVKSNFDLSSEERAAVSDSLFLLFAILFVSLISLYQDTRSKNALEKLRNYTQPKCKVIRDGKISEVNIEELVLGDSLMVEEGTSICADGLISYSNDFSVNESILKYKSLPRIPLVNAS